MVSQSFYDEEVANHAYFGAGFHCESTGMAPEVLSTS